MYLTSILPALTPSSPLDPKRECYYAFGLKPGTKRPFVTPCYSMESLLQTCGAMSDEGMNVYYAQAVFADSSAGRKQANVARLRALWADIDVGKANNSYATREEAVQGIVNFTKASGLTPTWVTSSGKGLYCYWCLTEDISRPKWERLAVWLGEAMKKLGFVYDPACTTDSARVLRMPGTFHQASGNKVKILAKSDNVYTWQELAEKLYAITPPSWAAAPHLPQAAAPMPAAAQAPVANAVLGTQQCFASAPVAYAEPIVARCNQICTAGLGTEPQWYAMMSVMKRCVDGFQWAHALSATDPSRYNEADTTAKYEHAPVDAPAKCETFALLNPGGCTGCPHKGRVKSPIQLWRLYGTQTTEAPVETEQPEPEPAPMFEPPAKLELPPVFTYTPQSFRTPEYYVDTEGCHWVETKVYKDGTVQQLDHIITTSQLYYLKTVWTWKSGRSQREHWFLVVNPNGHKEQVSLDAAIASSPQNLMGWLYSSNIFPSGTNFTAKHFMAFINAYLNSILSQNAVKEVATTDTFGWKEADPQTGQAPGFCIGSGRITENGMMAQEYTGSAKKLALGLGSAGTLDGWRPVAEMYKTLDQKAAQLGMCLALAAPFMKYGSGVATSATYSLWSTQSGLGKTQLLRAAASVWGNPDRQWIQRNASAVMRMRQLAVLNNLPAFMDELTDVSDEDLYSLAYSLVGGQEKNKLRRNGVDMVETGTWNTVTFITSNKSVKEAVARCSGDSSASVTRLIEYECDFESYADNPTVTEYINSCIAACATNYGIAGPTLIYNAMQHSDRLNTLTAQLEHWVMRNGFRNEERFMAFPLALAIKIGRWAVEWGIINYDMDALESWVLSTFLAHNRVSTKNYVKQPKHVLLAYLTERQRNLLQVKTDMRRDAPPPPNMPDPYIIVMPQHADILLRMTADEGRLYIAKSDLDKWCKRFGHSPVNLWQQLALEGVTKQIASCNLGTGTSSIILPNVPCYVLERDSVEKLGFSPEIPTSQPNAANSLAAPFK